MNHPHKEPETIYVIGHKNPDTDSIVSAIGYADLKTQLGHVNVKPARAGKLNLQTEYILNRFKVPSPHFISDLIPKVRHYMSTGPVTINRATPLWKALEILNGKQYKMLPIVDESGTYLSSLHYNAFAENMLKKIDPQKKGIITTSIGHLIETLNAQSIAADREDELFKSHIVVAAQDPASFSDHIKPLSIGNLIVIVGNRPDIQKMAVNEKIRCLIVTGGKTVDKEMKDLAQKNGVSILVSPYDTSTTSWLALYSTPVWTMGDTTVYPVKSEEYIKNIRDHFADSVSKSLTVVNDDNRVIGIITQSDLMKNPSIEMIMVDHNEISQAVDGIENFRIREIIDHHRLGNIYTSQPITFINKPVGSTSTIVASLFLEHRVAMKKEIASILLAGILSDTLIFQSSTATEIDREIAQYLADITDLSIAEFGRDIMNAASLVSSKPTAEILSMDMKKYEEGDHSFSVSQVEVMAPQEIMERKEEIIKGLEELNQREKNLFTALLVTDIVHLSSVMFIAGARHFIDLIGYHKIGENIFDMKGILSRKKQLIPILTELMKKVN